MIAGTPSLMARILSPVGIYPNESVLFHDSAYVKSKDIVFTVCKQIKHTRGGDTEDDSYSELEWLNPLEAKLYGSMLLSVDRREGYYNFYPFPVIESVDAPDDVLSLQFLHEVICPLLVKKLCEPDIIDPGELKPSRSKYDSHSDIQRPLIAGGVEYNFNRRKINHELLCKIYRQIDIDDALLIRGLTTLLKAEMLHRHYQFYEAAICTLFISLEVSFRLVVRKLKEEGVENPTSTDAMGYINNAFYAKDSVTKYFEEYYAGRVMTFHPESRFGTFPHAPLASDDYYFLFRSMTEVYAYLICGYVSPQYKDLV